ncbi:MAG: hypothetical protein LBH38_00410, partial [Holosporales bacterium]|nr:hypothetical protein [Holosporales bacterium]
ILPTLPHWKAHLQEKTHYWPYPPIITTSSAEKGLAFYAASAALAVSGTVTLELACARTPTVVTYRTDSVSAFLIRPLLRTPFIALPNIVMQKSVMPEFLQEKCTPILLANAIREILLPKRQEEIKRMLGEVREKIHSQGITAADIVERYLGF